MSDSADLELVLAANASFYAAFEMLDHDAMSRAWSDAAPISCIHPSGTLLEGRDVILSSWREIFRSTTSIHFVLERVRAFVAGDTAWIVLTETIDARHGEGRVRASAQATNVFVREKDGWKLVHHHAEPASAPASRRPRTSTLN